jgi:hypothetical protein
MIHSATASGQCRLPTFIVIGAMKCGTSSLYEYLKVHPDICMSFRKETDFFCLSKRYERGLSWYESQFKRPALAYGEASPNYTKADLFPHVPERMKAALPNVKLIYVLRDPVERTVSEYLHLTVKGYERRPMLEALTATVGYNPYVAESQYHRQLSEFLKFYDASQILLLTSEQLRCDTAAAMRQVYGFVGVDPSFKSPVFNHAYHRTVDKLAAKNPLAKLTRQLWTKGIYWPLIAPWMPAARQKPASSYLSRLDAATQSLLIERIKPDIDRLRAFSGLSFSEWSL